MEAMNNVVARDPRVSVLPLPCPPVCPLGTLFVGFSRSQERADGPEAVFTCFFFVCRESSTMSTASTLRV